VRWWASRHTPKVVCAVALLGAAAACLFAPARATAQQGLSAGSRGEPVRVEGTDNTAIADALFVAARGLMEAERYPEACAKLAESYRLDPASGTLLNLAVCHEHEGKLASAWGEFRAALHEAEAAQRADRAQLAREHADALGPELPFLALEVPGAARVPGLEIVRNGVPTLEAAWTDELPVDPGRVRLEVRAPGYQTQTREVSIAPRQHLTVEVPALAPEHVAGPKLAVSDLSVSVDRSPVEGPRALPERRPVGLGLIVAGALTTGVGITAGVLTLHKRGLSDDACPKLDGERRCTQAGVDAMASARKWAVVSDVTIGVGVLGLAAGTYMLLRAAREEQTDRTRALRSTLHNTRPGGRSCWSWNVAASAHGARGVVARSF